jgi:hypothetical protein
VVKRSDYGMGKYTPLVSDETKIFISAAWEQAPLPSWGGWRAQRDGWGSVGRSADSEFQPALPHPGRSRGLSLPIKGGNAPRRRARCARWRAAARPPGSARRSTE